MVQLLATLQPLPGALDCRAQMSRGASGAGREAWQGQHINTSAHAARKADKPPHPLARRGDEAHAAEDASGGSPHAPGALQGGVNRLGEQGVAERNLSSGARHLHSDGDLRPPAHPQESESQAAGQMAALAQ